MRGKSLLEHFEFYYYKMAILFECVFGTHKREQKD